MLSRLYYEETNGNTLAKRDWKQQVIETLRALITSEPIKLYNRAVWLRDQGIVYYNLSNKKNQILKITKHGGEIIKQSPELIIFKKLPDNYVQVLPDQTYNITDKTDYLDKFLDNYNFEDENEKKILQSITYLCYSWIVPHIRLTLSLLMQDVGKACYQDRLFR